MPPDQKKALALSLFTVGYNTVEGAVSIVAALLSDSTALLGFGLDSFVESLSGAVMVWRFWGWGVDVEDDEIAQVERKASRLIAYSFFILGGYVTIDAGLSLRNHEAPEPSMLGLVVAVASVIVMPALFVAKHRLGREIGSRSLIADSKETLACLMLSAALLVGLLLNQFLGFWWADAVSALVIAALVFREGWESFEQSRNE